MELKFSNRIWVKVIGKGGLERWEPLYGEAFIKKDDTIDTSTQTDSWMIDGTDAYQNEFREGPFDSIEAAMDYAQRKNGAA
jgi:hypothetical protein